jgi:putative FmdB family regulatory protein
MPTYDYRCKDCTNEFEVVCKIAEMDLQRQCPECNSMETERFIGGAPAFGDPFRLGVKKLPSGFREVLKKIDKTPGSRLKETSSFL